LAYSSKVALIYGYVAPQEDDPVELGFQFLGFLPVALHQPSIQGSVLVKSLNTLI